jgi:phosphomannomutase
VAEANELIVSVSGIRGIVGKSLTPQTAVAFAMALASQNARGRIVLCRDGRPSGLALRHAVLAGLMASGCDVADIGIAPTPTCGVAIRELNAAGGIQLTASHNPAAWNGLKLFGSDGAVLNTAAGQVILERFRDSSFRHAAWNEQGQEDRCLDAGNWHQSRILSLVDAEPIRLCRPRVFLDANGGAGGPLGKSLLEALGTTATCHACAADGHFFHEPEPIAANLREICPLVPQSHADIGFVLDPDADRLAIIDENGQYIGEELTLALAVRYRLGQERGPVVINMSTSRLCEDIARQFGCPCHRSAVGEANVVERMKVAGAVIGGEGNGGVIDPRVGWVRDPFIGMALVLSLLAETGKKLSELVAEFPSYQIVKNKATVTREQLPALYQALTSAWPEARTDRLDGLRLDWEDRWVHVRPSNTEPIVRVIAEAPHLDQAQDLCDQVGQIATTA